MQSSWRLAASARSRSPTARAVKPPMPASISSKTSVALAAARAEAAQREHDPRELAAGRRVAQRRGRHPRVGRDEELDGLGAVRAEAVRVGFEGDLERARPPSPARRARPRPARRAARPLRGGRRRARSASAARSRLGRGLDPRPELARPALRVLKSLDLGAAMVGVVEHRVDRAAVLALQPVERVEPLLDRLEPARLRVDVLDVAAQVAGELVELEPGGAQALGEAVELGVEAVDRRPARTRRRRARRGRRRRPRRRRRAPRGRRRPRRAARRHGGGARSRRRARPPPSGRGRPRRSRRARSASGRGRARASPRAREARRARPSARSTRAWAAR